jgi:hypothetical protein
MHLLEGSVCVAALAQWVQVWLGHQCLYQQPAFAAAAAALLLLLLLLPCSRWRDSRRGVVEEEVEEEEEEEEGGMMGGADLGAMLQGMSGPDAQVGGRKWST